MRSGRWSGPGSREGTGSEVVARQLDEAGAVVSTGVNKGASENLALQVTIFATGATLIRASGMSMQTPQESSFTGQTAFMCDPEGNSESQQRSLSILSPAITPTCPSRQRHKMPPLAGLAPRKVTSTVITSDTAVRYIGFCRVLCIGANDSTHCCG